MPEVKQMLLLFTYHATLTKTTILNGLNVRKQKNKIKGALFYIRIPLSIGGTRIIYDVL